MIWSTQAFRCMWIGACIALLGLGAPIRAISITGVTEISDPKMTLTQIKVVSQGPSEATFEVEFYPKLPPYRAITDPNAREKGETNLAVRFENAKQGPSSRELKASGLIDRLDIVSDDTEVNLRFVTIDRSKISTTEVSANKLLIMIKRVPKRASSSFANFQSSDVPETPNVSANVTGAPLNGESVPLNDESVPFEEQGFELIKLKYADVSEVVGLLTEGISVRPNNILIRREPGFGSPGTNGSGSSNGQNSEDSDQPLGESVDRNLAIDRRLNAVWVRGSPDRIKLFKSQIALIDQPVDSVILETQFVELTESGIRNLGIDFNNGANQIGVGTLQSGQFNLDSPSPKTFLPSISLQAALYAQIQKGNGRILSKPRIAAQSGATAKIITGDSLPILTSITLSGVNGVSEQVQYVNVGVTLQIAPRVSPDGYVTSKIYAVVSSVSGYSQGYPTISRREAETSASVLDGESFVIGGLTQESVLNSKSKIPILGDIPILGRAFSYEKTLKGKTELYIVITPKIVKHRAVGPSPSGQ
jgi:general secretion pathway protein D